MRPMIARFSETRPFRKVMVGTRRGRFPPPRQGRTISWSHFAPGLPWMDALACAGRVFPAILAQVYQDSSDFRHFRGFTGMSASINV